MPVPVAHRPQRVAFDDLPVLPYLTLSQAGAVLGVSRGAVAGMVRRGVLPASRLSGAQGPTPTIVINAVDLDRVRRIRAGEGLRST